MLTLPETPGHPYRGVLAGPHLSKPCRFLVPPPFESLSLTLAGSGRVFVTGAGVTNNLILPPFLRLSNSMLAVFHTIHSRAKKEKRTKKERMLLLLLLKLILNSIGVTIRAREWGPPRIWPQPPPVSRRRCGKRSILTVEAL